MAELDNDWLYISWSPWFFPIISFFYDFSAHKCTSEIDASDFFREIEGVRTVGGVYVPSTVGERRRREEWIVRQESKIVESKKESIFISSSQSS